MKNINMSSYKFIRSLLLILISLHFHPFFAQSPKKKLKKARRLFTQERYYQAIPYFQAFLNSDSTKPLVYLETGLCYLFGSYKQDSAYYYIEKYEKKAKKTLPHVKYYKALAAFYILRMDEAEENFKEFQKSLIENSFTEEIQQNIESYLTYIDNFKKSSLDGQYWITDLPAPINSPSHEYSPIIFDSTNILFTTRRKSDLTKRRYWFDGNYYEDIYAIKKNLLGQWQLEPISSKDSKLIYIPANKRSHDATVTYNHQKNKMIIYRKNKLWYSEKSGDSWTKPVKFPRLINKSLENTPSGYFSLNNDTLYFVSVRKDGIGNKDIYYTVYQNGKWAEPVNLGPSINTPEDEDAPYMTPRGELYFSSKAHGSIGGYDIFKTHQNPDGSWTQPVQLPRPVNSIGHDIFYQPFDGSTGHFFFSSNRPGGLGGMDIYEGYYGCKPVNENILAINKIATGNADLKINNRKMYEGDTIAISSAQKLIWSVGELKDTFLLPNNICENMKYTIGFEMTIDTLQEGIRYRGSLNYTETWVYRDDLNRLQSGTNDLLLIISIDTILPLPAGIQNQQKQHIEFVFNFDYNNTKISDTNEAFQQFMHKVKKTVEAYKGIEVSIIASASKVPTSTFKSNEELAKKRLEDAKKVFMDNCKKLGISVEKFIIAEEKFLVQGPSYENDPENTDKYSPYQFVKFIVKF